MNESRTKNAIRNIKTGLIVQLVNKILVFIVRTIFIKCLNSEYLGINGLFTNILTMLSFTELGIGTAIIFSMYKPIAENDKEKIKSLMKLYKISYAVIGVIVFLLGLLIIPFINVLVSNVSNIKENIVLIYLLFLINTSISYFFTYKKSIIIAHQKQSVINKYDTLFYIFKCLTEIIFLISTKNYIIYLIIEILSTFIENVILSNKANKMFPYIKEKNIELISKKEKKNIFKNVKSLVVYKFGEVILTGTDNILISSMISVSAVGICSNYSMIIQAVESILILLFNGITASIGNLNVTEDVEKKENIFYQLTLINFFVYSFCAIAFIVLLNPFIELWLGLNYTCNISVVIALAVSFYIKGIRLPGYIFRTTLGLFNKGKITPYIAAIVNIVSSIILCKLYGIVGIFIGTSLAQLSSYTWIDPYLIHKYEFKTSVLKYFKKFFIYICAFLFNLILTLVIIGFINYSSFYGFIMKTILVIFIPNIINLLLFFKTQEFKQLSKRIFNLI